MNAPKNVKDLGLFSLKATPTAAVNAVKFCGVYAVSPAMMMVMVIV